MTGHRQTTPARVVVGLVVAFILVVTLYPMWDQQPQPLARCVICGSRGTSDAILNFVLFLPLGAALVLAGVRPMHAAALALWGSLTIELTQLYVPGRDSSFGDLLFNTLGGSAGAYAAARRVSWRLAPQKLAARLSLAAGIMVLVVVFATGALLGPDLPQTRYYGQWTPELGHLHAYDGRVLEAVIGSVHVPGTAPHAQRELRAAIREGEPIRVRALAGTAPPRLASLFSIYDEQSREILLVGLSGDDLVYRQRTRAAVVRLTSPGYHAKSLLARLEQGEVLSIDIQREGSRVCLSVNGRSECGVAFTAAAGRRLLYDVDGLSAGLEAGLDAVWLAVLALPFGFWARRRGETYAGGAILLAALLFAPGWTGLADSAWTDLIGVGGGVLLGMVLRKRAYHASVLDASLNADILRRSENAQYLV